MTASTTVFHKIDIQKIIDNSPMTLEITASPEECAKVAKRCDILEVKNLTAKVILSTGKRSDLFRIQTNLKTDIAQACGVTLVPIAETIKESFDETLTTSEAALVAPEDITAAIEQPVELIENNMIDIGEIICEWLILTMDPYPRTEVPEFKHIEVEEVVDGVKTYKPFDVLKDIKGK